MSNSTLVIDFSFTYSNEITRTGSFFLFSSFNDGKMFLCVQDEVDVGRNFIENKKKRTERTNEK